MSDGMDLLRCHSGHESVRALWVCPVCHDADTARLAALEAVAAKARRVLRDFPDPTANHDIEAIRAALRSLDSHEEERP